MKKTFLLSFFLFLFLLDFFSKMYVHNCIPSMNSYFPVYPYGGIGVFHDVWGIDFSINHVVNKGAAWGMFASFQDVLLYVRLIIIGAILSYLVFVSVPLSRQIPLVMILSGAIGNVLDFFLYGHVIDMFHFKFWGHSFAVFNVADSAITCGIAWLFLLSFSSSMKGSKKADIKAQKVR
jgi:signal peptidase II